SSLREERATWRGGDSRSWGRAREFPFAAPPDAPVGIDAQDESRTHAGTSVNLRVATLAALGAAALLGSIPNGLLIARAWTGADVRSVGSGNIGATNV